MVSVGVVVLRITATTNSSGAFNGFIKLESTGPYYCVDPSNSILSCVSAGFYLTPTRGF